MTIVKNDACIIKISWLSNDNHHEWYLYHKYIMIVKWQSPWMTNILLIYCDRQMTTIMNDTFTRNISWLSNDNRRKWCLYYKYIIIVKRQSSWMMPVLLIFHDHLMTIVMNDTFTINISWLSNGNRREWCLYYKYIMIIKW